MKVKLTKTLFLIAILFIVSILAIIGGCGKKDENKTAEEWTLNGWEKFERRDYSGALSAFMEAIAEDPTYPDAYNGIGWSQLRLRSEDVAHHYFSLAIGYDSLNVDAYVGRAGVLLKLNLYDEAIVDAKKALALNGTYNFSHDQTIKFTDIRFLILQANYYLTNYTQAKNEVDWMRNLFSLPPINWYGNPIVVDGVEFKSLPEALLKAIENLKSKV